MTESSDYESIQVFIGVDEGKDTHHAVAVNRSGKRLFDRALPNDENKLRALISDLNQHGQILLAYFHERRSLNNFHRDRVITFEQIAE